MTNFEKYQQEVLGIIIDGQRFAVNVNNGKPCGCDEISCMDCEFHKGYRCESSCRKTWLETECEEY